MNRSERSHRHVRHRGRPYFEKTYADHRAGYLELRGSHILRALPRPKLISYQTIGQKSQLIYEHVLGEILSHIETDAKIGFIATALSDIHSMQWQNGHTQEQINRTQIRHQLAMLFRFSTQLPGVTDSIISEWDRYYSELRLCPIRTMIHGDISGNIIETGLGFMLVDFEHVGPGDPAYELAAVMCRHDVDDNNSVFVRSYRHKSIISFARRYSPLVIVENLLWALENWKLHQTSKARKLLDKRLDYFHAYRLRLDDSSFTWRVVGGR